MDTKEERELREQQKERQLIFDLTDTFMAGFKGSRPDLDYPQSTSDVQSGIRAIIKMFDTKRKPLI